jgi:ribosomal protein S4
MIYNKLVYQNALGDLRQRLRQCTRKTSRRIWKNFKDASHRFKPFIYNTNTIPTRRRRRRSSRRGLLLKLRRKISLFYGGGRIRRKTFRRYGRMVGIRRGEKRFLGTTYSYTHLTYTSIIESRLDVLLLRSNFVDSIYRARSYIFNHKCKVSGHARITHPAFLIKNFQFFGLKDHYTKKLRKSLLTRIKKHTVINIPSYLFVNFPLLVAFKIENPDIKLVSYPCVEQPNPLRNFRKLFQFL